MKKGVVLWVNVKTRPFPTREDMPLVERYGKAFQIPETSTNDVLTFAGRFGPRLVSRIEDAIVPDP